MPTPTPLPAAPATPHAGGFAIAQVTFAIPTASPVPLIPGRPWTTLTIENTHGAEDLRVRTCPTDALTERLIPMGEDFHVGGAPMPEGLGSGGVRFWAGVPACWLLVTKADLPPATPVVATAKPSRRTVVCIWS